MSLLNLIVHPEIAYVITDSGHYDIENGGTVTRLGPKSMLLEQHNLIIASAGQLQCAHLAKGILAHQQLPQAELVKALPEIARRGVDEYGITLASAVVFAGYSKATGEAFGGAFQTHGVGAPTAEHMYRIFPKRALLLPPLADQNLSTLQRPTAFNPHTNLMGIIERQRRFDFGSPGKRIGCCIAGNIDVVSVSRDGFGIKTIHTYPAQIGQKVIAERSDFDVALERDFTNGGTSTPAAVLPRPQQHAAKHDRL